MKKHPVIKYILIAFGAIMTFLITFVSGFLIYASSTTLKVKSLEDMKINGKLVNKIDKTQELSLLTWNMGYGALDEKQDFYMDGGKNVTGESKEIVEANVKAIQEKIKEINPDFAIIQEMDINSKRSFRVNEYDLFKEEFNEDTYDNSFALNFKAGFIPVPLYEPIGKVESGIASFSKYHIDESKRIQLPIPFSWPVSLLNLKRCLLVTRISIEGNDKSLVLINLHLEAYDDGEGKAKQLKQLMDVMEEESAKGNYVIAGGDFNQTFSNINYAKYPKMNDWVCPVIDTSEYPNFSFLMDDDTPTCRSLYKPYYDSDKANHQYYMIDGFIVSNNIQVNHLETLDLGFKNTDHNPISLKVNLM